MGSLTMSGKLRCWMIAGLTCVGVLAPRSAQACHEVNVCMRFSVAADDLAVGDFPELGEFWGGGPIKLPGRNLRVMLIPPPPEAPSEVIADSEGCFTLSTEWVWGHKMLVYADAFHGDTHNIRVTAYDSYSNVVSETEKFPWIVDLKHLVEDAEVIVNIPTDNGTERMFAWANWIVGRLEDELEPGLTGEKILQLYSQNKGLAELDGDGFAYLGGYGIPTRIYLQPSFTHKRFTIAHEIGHWLHANWIDSEVGGGYSYDTQDDACQFEAVGSNVLHGLRSSEYGGDALREGFAHFIASWVFDDTTQTDARFKYYKSIDDQWMSYGDLIGNDYIVSLLGGSCDEDYIEFPDSCPQEDYILGGDSAWVECKCPNDWGYPNDEVSSELDWMRFFWQLSSGDAVASSPVATLREVLLVLEATQLSSPNWSDLDTAVWTPANTDIYDLRNRFDDLTALNGLDNGNG